MNHDTAMISEPQLEVLVTELSGDVALCAEFVRAYVAAWESRMEALHDALASHDPTLVATALLSIRTSSAMVGASAIVTEATRLATLADDCRISGDGALVRLHTLGIRSCLALERIANEWERRGP